jgi:hypothetical protein
LSSTAVLAADAAGEQAPTDDGPAPALRGRLALEYVPRWVDGTDTGDQDLYASVELAWGDSDSRWSGSISCRAVKDLDGAHAAPGGRFRSVYDTYGDDWFGQLFHAHVEMRTGGVLERTRLGRQYLHKGHPFYFDGLAIESRRARGGLRASIFGGVPVHFFEPSSGGDWLAGVGIELRPWRGGLVELLYAHFDDETQLLGMPSGSNVSDLVVASVRSRLGERCLTAIRHTTVNTRTRDLLARFRFTATDARADVHVVYYLQPLELEILSSDLAAVALVEGTSHPYSRIDVRVATRRGNARGWTTRLTGRAATRRLIDPSDETEYNREYDVLWFGVDIASPGRRSSAHIGPLYWWSSEKSVWAMDAEARWEREDRWHLSVGTTYSVFKYDALSLAEQADVHEVYARARWKVRDELTLKLRYAAERYDGDLVHEMECGCAFTF